MSKQQAEKRLSTVQKNITSKVLAKINILKESKELTIPKDYSPENALKSAYLILNDAVTRDDKPVLTACSQGSIANALLKMVIWGLSPMKGQCSFIPYGTKLECQPEYTGNIALAKRYGNLKRIRAFTIYEGDTFEFEIDADKGVKRIVEHKQSLESLAKANVKGAYAVYELLDGTIDVEIMSIEQIQKSWMQGAAKGNSKAHKNFPDQMAEKTVINRACKLLIRGSNDSILYAPQGSEAGDPVDETKKDRIKEDANLEELGIEDNLNTIEVEAEEVSAEEPETADEPSEEQQELDPDKPPF